MGFFSPIYYMKINYCLEARISSYNDSSGIPHRHLGERIRNTGGETAHGILSMPSKN